MTDNAANYRAKDFTRTVEALTSRQQRIRAYTPWHTSEQARRTATEPESITTTTTDRTPPVASSLGLTSRPDPSQ